MLYSQTLIPTLKENPSDAEVASHILMLRAGYIRKLASGAYSYLPLGLRSLNKVISIIREEMNSKLSLEVLLPAIQPVELWKKSGRYDILGDDMISFMDRHGKETVLGPTHEEVITDLAGKEIKSYRNLPKIFYQIQTKFRDEPRPRFGVIRSKEFIMMDAYSFDADIKGLNFNYKKMYDAFCKVFNRCGLNFIPVEADTGFMGGDVSHEFMVPSPSGEDTIVLCNSCKYAASFDKAETLKNDPKRSGELKTLKEASTPNISTVKDVAKYLRVKEEDLVKTIFYKSDGVNIAVLLRGDYDINEAKLKNHLKAKELLMADSETIAGITKAPVGFSGPVGLKNIKILSDYSIIGLTNFVTGANKKDMHLINVNVNRDFKVDEWLDLRFITKKDPCPKCGASSVKIDHAIEVGHTFKLGTKYSDSLGAQFLDESGKLKPMIMGCYGIGVNRIIAACIEQNHDEFGMMLPQAIAPYKVLILPLNMENESIKKTAESIYEKLMMFGDEVLMDDRLERGGIKFKDADLIGIPIQIIIGEKNLKNNKVELKIRRENKVMIINIDDVENEVKKLLG